MKNRWDQARADALAAESPLGLRVYTSNLLGADADLVLHGGGNTSLKGQVTDLFGEAVPVLYVKGSGWDLRSIQAAGFPAVRLAHLERLGRLEALSDSEMMRQLRLGLLDPGAPTPSVEAILHALIPCRYVDHTHADAVVTLSNTPDGESRLRELYGDEVLILPYTMPGFILARQVAEATRGVDWSRLRGMVLLHHGIFTFADEARQSYDNMIDLVERAEQALLRLAGAPARLAPTRTDDVKGGTASVDFTALLRLSELRRAAGEICGDALLVQLDTSTAATDFAGRADAAELIGRGPLTPDHTIHAKPFGAVFGADPSAGLQTFRQDYESYFQDHAGPEHTALDPVPRYGVWSGRGMVYLAANAKRLGIVRDITRHTVAAMQRAEAIAAWQSLPRRELFAVEYWELEQAKLKGGASRAPLAGRVALVTGAASGIGRACVDALLARGAAVVALDLNPAVTEAFAGAGVLTVPVDVTDREALEAALAQAVQRFGGLDMLVSNAGSFPPSMALEAMEDEVWQASLELNLTAHMRLLRAAIPFLRSGFDPAVVMVASKNVPAPGPGAAAYSVAKAGLTQLARVAALELGEHGIRINTVHPNAVYDTAIWTDEVLAERAGRYGLSVAEYRSANVLKTEILARDVAAGVIALLGPAFARTTGAQVPIDGGNERVI
ncbi:MAG: bifunctional aldolase/short-chain dehydrogenase [Pseudohongiellaceae bacterium]